MADKLSMSLDDIISTKSKKSHNSNARQNKPKAFKSASRPAPKIQAQKSTARQSFQVRVTDEDDPSSSGPARSTKIINIERSRPKVVLPAQNTRPVSTSQFSTAGSVFERLGGPSTRVVFSNLAKSVERNDVLELCNAVGAVKQIFFEKEIKGLGQVKVVFENERDSYNCVTKYNGVALDGLAMLVAVEKGAAPQAAGVFGRLQVPQSAPTTSRVSQANNVKAGLFGTSLHEQEESQDETPSRIVFQARERPNSGRGGGDRRGGSGDRKGSDGSRGKRQGGGGRGRGPPREKKAPSSHEDMDADLDNYMNQR